MQVSLTFLYIAFFILVATHVLEIAALFKLSSLKGNSIGFFRRFTSVVNFFCHTQFATIILLHRSWSWGYVASTSEEVLCCRSDDGCYAVRLHRVFLFTVSLFSSIFHPTWCRQPYYANFVRAWINYFFNPMSLFVHFLKRSSHDVPVRDGSV